MTSPPAVVQRAAQLAAADHSGIVAYRIERTSVVRAPVFGRRDDLLLAAVFDGDRLVRVRVIRDVHDGQPQSDAAKADLARSLLTQQRSGGFAVPFDVRHFAEYRYAVQAAGVVSFTAVVRDAHHGDGTFTVGADGNVTVLDYRPAALPAHATYGEIVDERAQVLPGFWATVRSEEHYDGHLGPFHGSASVTMVQSGFTRFATLADALSALDGGRV